MAQCTNCGASLLFGLGRKEGEHKFCSKKCLQFWKHPGYCQSCVQNTTEESLGGTFTLNVFFGTRLMGFSGACPTCGSKVMRKWFWIVLPLFPVSKQYRVLYQTDTRFFSRKIREQPG